MANRVKYVSDMMLVFLLVASSTPAFGAKRPAFDGLYGHDATPATSTLASGAALVDGDKATNAGMNIGGPGNTYQNIGLNLGSATVVEQIRLYTTSPHPAFNENNFIWAVYSSNDNIQWTLITGAAIFEYDSVENRFGISFAETTARYFKVVNTANDVNDLYVTEIEALGDVTEKGDVNADGDVDLADAILGLKVLSGLVLQGITKSGDANDDGRVGIAETIFALQEVAGLHNHPPELNPIGGKSIDEKSTLSFTINAIDPDEDPLTYSASNLPDGASFYPNTRTFSWRPTYAQSGIHDVTFSVTDNRDGWDSETIAITVNDKTPVFGASDYFPLAVGNWWDYKDNATGEVSRSTITGDRFISGTVTKVYEYADGTKRYYTSDSNGVRVYGEYVKTDEFTGDVIFDAPVRYLPDNAQIGTSEISTTHYSITIYVPGHGNVTVHVDLTSTTIVLNLEDIQTEHSTLRDCVKVSNQITQVVEVEGIQETVVGDTVLYWLCEGIGVVKTSSSQADQIITQSHVDGETRTY